MGESEGPIEDEEVGCGCEEEVDDAAEEPFPLARVSELRRK